MENPFEEFEDIVSFSDKEVFTEIWTAPRRVFRFIHENMYEKYMVLLLILAGISRAFDRAAMRNLGDEMSLVGILATCIIIGGLLGWLSYYVYAALISWTGTWLKGESDTRSILRIIAYAMIPSIVALLLLVPQLMVYGNEVFKADGDVFSGGWFSNFIFYGSAILELTLGIWTLVLLVIGVSEAQKFSIGKSILNLFLPVLVIGVPILLLVMIFSAF